MGSFREVALYRTEKQCYVLSRIQALKIGSNYMHHAVSQIFR